MHDIIDLTVSPQPDVIELSSDQGNTPPGSCDRTQEKKRRKRKKRRTSNGVTSDGIGSSAQSPRIHSPEVGNRLDESTSHHAPTSTPPLDSSTIIEEPDLFCFDYAPAPITVENSSPPLEPVQSNEDDGDLLLPSHVSIFHDEGSITSELLPPPKQGSDNEEYIEYLNYEDRKAPGLVRYFEIEDEESKESRLSISKCKNCGAEGDHKTYECPIQICLTCGARDEHSTRSCPITKTCYNCGMKGHINKTCPNRFSVDMVSSDCFGECDRCGSTEHKMNECPTLWRIYQYVNDEERMVIMQSREKRKQLAIGNGGEGYVGKEMWCYNCANLGHLGDDCDELPHPVTFPTEHSAFSYHNVASGPFYDAGAEPISMKRGSRDRESEIERHYLRDNWDADVPIDVGKRGKNKDRERLEKRYRAQEDEGEDWFDNGQNVKRRGMERQAPPPGSRGKTFKFGSFKGEDLSSGPSLLARLGDTCGGRNGGKNLDYGKDQREQPKNSIRIRGAAAEQSNQDGRHTSSRDLERGQDRRERDKYRDGGSRRENRPRYKGGYDRY